MCAILDADVRDTVFGDSRPPAGVIFYKWIMTGGGCLVVDECLLKELNRGAPESFKEWQRQAQFKGSLKKIDDKLAKESITELENAKVCRSNDVHIIALAKISGSRLLFSNDKKLRDDFKDRNILDPTGKLYSRNMKKRTCRQLLAQKDLCDQVRKQP